MTVQLNENQSVERLASDLFAEVMERLGRDHQWNDPSVDQDRWKTIAAVVQESLEIYEHSGEVEDLMQQLHCGNTGPGEECQQRNEDRPDGCFRCYRQQMTLMDELVRQRRSASKAQDEDQNEYLAAAVDLAQQAAFWRQEGRRPEMFDAALSRFRRAQGG